MEYASNGSLSNLIKTVKPLPHPTCKFFVAEIVLALEYLHKQNISHRDIKPENILLDEKYHIKVCDFGEAKIIKNQNKKAVIREIDNYYKKNQVGGGLKNKGLSNGVDGDGNEDDDEDYEDLNIEVEPETGFDTNNDAGYTYGDDDFDPEEFRTESIFNQVRFDKNSEQEDQFDGMFDEQETTDRMTKLQNPDPKKVQKIKEDDDDSFDFSGKNQTVRGTFVGTPLYASPEMLSCSISGPYTDLWALGVIIYQLFTGEVPWKSN